MAREHDQAEVAVGAEAPQAILRVVDIERRHLPGEMGTGGAHADEEHDLGVGKQSGGRDPEPGKP